MSFKIKDQHIHEGIDWSGPDIVYSEVECVDESELDEEETV